MIQALTMPAWGMEDAPGTVVEWLVEEGAQINMGDEIVEIETTKLTNVVESPFSGTIARIVLQQGANAPTGALLAVFADSATSSEEIQSFIEEHSQEDTAAGVSEPTASMISTGSGDVRLMTQTGGDAAPLLLLHGFGADWTNWSFISSSLSHKRTVHLLDLPGHGASFKDVGSQPLEAITNAVLSVIQKLGCKLHLAGHSLGGLVAAQVAAKAGGNILSLSLVAPVGFASNINGEFLEAFADSDRRKQARGAIEMLVSDPDSVSLAMVNDVIRARRVEGAKEALHAIRAALADGSNQIVDIRGVLDGLAAPVQMILGDEDRIVEIRDFPAGVETTTISGAGHLLHIEKAGEVQRLLENFMEQSDE